MSETAPCSDLPLPTRIEALLLTADKPVTEARLAALLGLDSKGAAKVVQEAIGELNEHYDETKRSFRAERLAGGWQLLTVPDYFPLLTAMQTERQQAKLSPAALETLAIIAYRQPIMRAEIEAIRGVAAGEVLRGLLERRLVKIVGRAEELGRPMLYGTTQEFLRVFGLSGPDDLPPVETEKADRAKPLVEIEESPPVEAGAEAEADAGPADEADDDQPGPPEIETEPRDTGSEPEPEPEPKEQTVAAEDG